MAGSIADQIAALMAQASPEERAKAVKIVESQSFAKSDEDFIAAHEWEGKKVILLGLTGKCKGGVPADATNCGYKWIHTGDKGVKRADWPMGYLYLDKDNEFVGDVNNPTPYLKVTIERIGAPIQTITPAEVEELGEEEEHDQEEQ